MFVYNVVVVVSNTDQEVRSCVIAAAWPTFLSPSHRRMP